MSGCLLESSSARRNKISLTDYNYQKDIQNRLLFAKLDSTDLRVLEEILYSSLHIRIPDLARSSDLSPDSLLPILDKFSSTGLFSIDKETICVDKEWRKYFEVQLQRLDDGFRPDMEFLQNLLKKIPIHVLPVWYSIPRTSNNIFESLVEKHLLTPQIFQRYVMEINFGEPVLKKIIEDVQESEDLEVPVADLMRKYNITRELFEEYMLHLEFSFICCVTYKKTENGVEERVSPFHEWKEYIRFLQNTRPEPIQKQDEVLSAKKGDFCFVEDAASLLLAAQKQPVPIQIGANGLPVPSVPFPQDFRPDSDPTYSDPESVLPYVGRLIRKLSLVKLIDLSSGQIEPSSSAAEWLSMSPDKKSLYLYRHPLNKILSKDFSGSPFGERAMREAEKSISRVLDQGWVLFDEFFKGCLVPLKEEDAVHLKKTGKNWKYNTPVYSSEEREFLRAVVFEWLFEAALIEPGLFEGKPCFRVTSLGRTLFGR